MDNKNKKLSLQEKKTLIGHYPYMLQALAVAVRRVPAWRLAKDGKPCSLLDVFAFAKSFDEAHPRKDDDPAFFSVSIEGAIGYSESGLEYGVSWFFLPMEPGKERDALVKIDQLEYQRAEAELKAKEEAAKAAPVIPEKGAPVIPSEAKESIKPRFCKHCGAPQKNPNAKFCSSCGKPLA